MAHEGSFVGERGQTDYWVTIEKNDSGTMKVYDVVAGSNTFVVWDTADQDDYDITPAEASPGKYTFTFPADIAVGDYEVTIRRGSKADADETAGVTHGDSVHWDGTELTRNTTSANMRGTDDANTTTPPTVGEVRTEMETDGGKLDHLHEMTEDDGGVRRLTENALEEAPSGTGGDATAANQTTIIGYTALAKKILANKAVQNKLTGVITYYDDDDITPLLTITPTDDGSLITRTPS